MNGILIVDKPEGMTSHDVVQAIRKKFDTAKAGHLGTLDPMATGVLPICVGKATRVGQFLSGSPKEYEGEIRFGFSTTTYDREGTPTSEQCAADFAGIPAAMKALTGACRQIPPPFSAKKIGGVPSYKLARKSQSVELAPVTVDIERFEMVDLSEPFMRFRVVCSPGTYVRSLAHDLGRRLGCGAHLTALRRTRSGDFQIGQAVPLDRISTADLFPMERLLESWPRIDVSGTEEVRVVHGHEIRSDTEGKFARIFNKKGEFIAIAAVENGLAHPRLVLTSDTSD